MRMRFCTSLGRGVQSRARETSGSGSGCLPGLRGARRRQPRAQKRPLCSPSPSRIDPAGSLIQLPAQSLHVADRQAVAVIRFEGAPPMPVEQLDRVEVLPAARAAIAGPSRESRVSQALRSSPASVRAPKPERATWRRGESSAAHAKGGLRCSRRSRRGSLQPRPSSRRAVRPWYFWPPMPSRGRPCGRRLTPAQVREGRRERRWLAFGSAFGGRQPRAER
jgi:hypothetical protein